MAISVNEHLIIHNEGITSDIEIYLNARNEIFISEITDDSGSFFLTISKDEWGIIKEFIDRQLSE